MLKGPGQVKKAGIFIRPQATVPKAPPRGVTIPIATPLSHEDRDSWLEAASHRNPPRLPDIQKLRGWLRGRNRRKYRTLESLIRWAEKEYHEQFGILPEDARWLLP